MIENLRMRHFVQSSWSVRIVTLAVALMGGVSILSAMNPAAEDRLVVLNAFVPVEAQYGGFLAATVSGFVLLILSSNLWRRKQIAWFLTLIALTISAISHLVKGLDYEEASVSILLIVWLLWLRPQFVAQSDRPSIRRSLFILLGTIVFTLAYGTIGFLLLDHHFGVTFQAFDALRQTAIMMSMFYDPGLQPITGFGRYFAWSIYAVGIITIGIALLLLMRPVLLQAPATPQEQERARAIVARYGQTPLARFALLDDKSYVFTPGGSVIAFVVKNRVALALGDPIGPSEDLPIAIDMFSRHCIQHDWQAAWYQVRDTTVAAYRLAALDLLCIGQEAIVDLRDFTLKGKSAQDWRSALNRFSKLGYQANIVTPPLDDSLIVRLRAVSDAWLAQMHGREQHFSLGWFADAYIRESRVLVVTSPSGTLCAFATLLSVTQQQEIGVDLMRYRPDTEKGVMDYLFVTLIQWAQSEGYARFNLGLSALAGVGEQSNDPILDRVIHSIYEQVNRYYNFKGLHTFKEKFHPIWSPRYLAYPGATQLPEVLTALVEANAGDGVFWNILRGRA